MYSIWICLTMLPAVNHCVLPARVGGGSNHVTVEHNQTKGVGNSVVWPRGIVEHGHVTVCSCLPNAFYKFVYTNEIILNVLSNDILWSKTLITLTTCSSKNVSVHRNNMIERHVWHKFFVLKYLCLLSNFNAFLHLLNQSIYLLVLVSVSVWCKIQMLMLTNYVLVYITDCGVRNCLLRYMFSWYSKWLEIYLKVTHTHTHTNTKHTYKQTNKHHWF